MVCLVGIKPYVLGTLLRVVISTGPLYVILHKVLPGSMGPGSRRARAGSHYSADLAPELATASRSNSVACHLYHRFQQ